MIAAWMLYTIAVTLLLFVAASAAEYVGRALRAPTRVVWLVAMLAAVGLSAHALVSGLNVPGRVEAAVITGTQTFRIDTSGFDAAGLPSLVRTANPSRLGQVVAVTRATTNRIAGYAARVDVTSLDRWNRPLVATWLVLAVLALAWFAIALIRLRRIERTLTSASIDGHTVLVSDDIGPAVLGVVHSRIVLPRWFFGLTQPERDVILAHEREHADACDPALMYGGAVLVALQPWNVVLWPLFARLRLAVESDCDRRVLATTGNAHAYGRLLIAIYERTTSIPSPFVAFAEHHSNLEHRIRRIARRPRVLSATAVTSAIVAATLVVAACATSSPGRRAVVPMEAEQAPPASIALRRLEQQVPPPVALERIALQTAAPMIPPLADTALVRLQTAAQVAPLALATPAVPPPAVRVPPRAVTPPAAVRIPPRAEQSSQFMGRCSIFARGAFAVDTWFNSSAAGVRANRHTLGYSPDACVMDGDVVVMVLDSAHAIVSARDTSDASRAVTDVFILQVKSGLEHVGTGWYSAHGRATLTDSVFYYASAGHPTLAFRLFPGASIRGSGAKVIESPNMVAIHSRFVTWDVLPQMLTAPRCAPTVTASGGQRACFLVGSKRVELPIGE